MATLSQRCTLPAVETDEPITGVIKGKLPEWLKGVFIALSPGQWEFKDFTLNHWLDGPTIATKITLDESVKLEAKFLETDYYNGLVESGKPRTITYGTRAYADKNSNALRRLVSSYVNFDQSDNYFEIHKLGRFFVLGAHTCHMREIDLSTLKLREEKFHTGKLFGTLANSTLGTFDSKGDLYFCGTRASAGGTRLNVLRIAATTAAKSVKEVLKSVQVLTTLPNQSSTAFPYAHGFGLSENYAVYIEQPYYTSLMAIFTSTAKGQSYKDLFQWHPDERNRFKLIDKRTGAVSQCEIVASETFFFPYFINCYETEQEVIVDVLAWPSPLSMQQITVTNMRNNTHDPGEQYRALRFRIPLEVVRGSLSNGVKLDSKITLVPEVLAPLYGMDFPAINPQFRCKAYKYFYAAQGFKQKIVGQLVKVNTITMETKSWNGAPHYLVGFPVFVADESRSEEDAGVIMATLTPLIDGVPGGLVVLDAASFQEIGRVEFETSIAAPLRAYFWNKNDV